MKKVFIAVLGLALSGTLFISCETDSIEDDSLQVNELELLHESSSFDNTQSTEVSSERKNQVANGFKTENTNGRSSVLTDSSIFISSNFVNDVSLVLGNWNAESAAIGSSDGPYTPFNNLALIDFAPLGANGFTFTSNELIFTENGTQIGDAIPITDGRFLTLEQNGVPTRFRAIFRLSAENENALLITFRSEISGEVFGISIANYILTRQ